MRLSEYAGYDAVDLAKLVRGREVSAKELRDCALKAISKINPKLNFMAGDYFNDGGFCENGFMAGVPFLLKEGLGCKGGALAMGTRLASKLKAKSDSEVTIRLREGGVQILGETTAPEFGLYPVTESSRHGATLNPWNILHSPGGSSGGAAAAVSAGVVPVAQASDGGGSIRGPAHCTGLFGLKPSSGSMLIAKRGLFEFTSVHVISKSVRDSMAFFAIQGYAGGCRASLPVGDAILDIGQSVMPLRIGVWRNTDTPVPIDVECIAALDKAAALAESIGHKVEEVQFDVDWEELCTHLVSPWVHALPFNIDGLCSISGQLPSIENLDQMTLKLLALGREVLVEDLISSEVYFQKLRCMVDEIFSHYDICLMPVGVSRAPSIGAYDPSRCDDSANNYIKRVLYEYALFTPLLNITGNPAVSIPMNFPVNGLPAGVQAIAPRGEEMRLFEFSAQCENHINWAAKYPPVCVINCD